MSTVRTVERQIEGVEGFRVIIRYSGPGPSKQRDVRSDRSDLPSYPYRRARSENSSVADWIRDRFGTAYSGFSVDVLLGDGSPAHGRTLLRNVRASY